MLFPKTAKILLGLSYLLILTECNSESKNNIIVEKIDSLKVINAKTTELFKIKPKQLKEQGWENPTIFFSTIIVDSKKNIFAFEWNSGKVIKFDKEGILIAATGGRGKGPNEFNVENSGVGLTICGETIIAHDMNQPIIKVYDHNLNLKKEINIDGLLWSASCNKAGDILLPYINNYKTDIINNLGILLHSYQFSDTSSFAYKNLKWSHFNDEYIYSVHVTGDVLIVRNKYGEILRKIQFPTIIDDDNKPATIKNFKLYPLDNKINIYTKMLGNYTIHSFTPQGDYISSVKFPIEDKIIYQYSADSLYAISNNNSEITLYKIN